MSFISPINNSGKLPIGGTAQSNKIQPTKIEETGQAALQQLPVSLPAKPQSKGWGVWSFIGLGTKTEEQPSVKVESEEEEGYETALDEEGYETALDEEEVSDEEFYDFPEELNEENNNFEETEQQDVIMHIAEIEEEEEICIDIPEVEEEEVEEKIDNPQQAVKETAFRTYEAAKKSYWQRFKEAAGDTLLSIATPAVQAYATSHDKTINKEGIIADQKQEMLDQLHDPQFVEFYELVSATLLPIVKEKLLDPLVINTDSVSKNAVAQSSLILKILDIGLARGFANLARQVKQNRASIPNYDKQPTFVNVISLLCQKSSKHIDLQRLAEIEAKYRQSQADLQVQIQHLFPEIENDLKKKESLHKYKQEYLYSTDQNRKSEIKQALFPNITTIEGQEKQQIQDFFATLDTLHQKNRELNDIFSKISNEILLYILPNKLADLPEIPGWATYLFGNTIYNGIQSILANLFQQSYGPLENDEVRNEYWEKDLQTCLGAPDLKPVIKAPSALLVAFIKNFIQADPKVMSFTAEILDGLMRPQFKTGGAGVTETKKSSHQLLNQLSEQQLANWIVESLQAMLHTEDSNLIGLGHFVKQALNNFALGLMVKGAQLVIPQGEKIESHAFMKELSERIIEKFNSLQTDQAIPDEFWKNFVEGLPIPPVVKDVLVSMLIEKAKIAQEELKKKTPDFQKTQKLHAEAEKKILSYERGKELLSLTEKLSDQIIKQVLKENMGLTSTLGLGDTVEELFAQYLPGVTFSDELKDWFKENISALGMAEEGHSPKSILLLKQGIQAVLCSALVNTIETNFKNNSKDYTQQLLKNIQQAFVKAFADFDSVQRNKIKKALDIQAKIEKKDTRIKDIKAKISERPKGITTEQTKLLEATVSANTRYLRASNYENSLISKCDAILADLNTKDKTKIWTAEELPLISEVLIIRKIEAPNYSKTEDYAHALQSSIKNYENIALSQKLPEAQEKELTQRRMLLSLLEMSVQELQLISDAVNTNITLQHAKKEVAHLSRELKAKEEDVATHDQNKIDNAVEWKQAKHWMTQVLSSREEINKLSKEIADLEKELDTHLEPFQSLSNELAALLGLDQKENLKLPPFLEDQVWPLIQTAKKEHIARLLFTQLSPMIMPIIERNENREKLKEKSGSDFLGELCEALSKDVFEMLPVILNSHRAAAKKILLLSSNGKKPDSVQIDQLAQEISALAKQKNVKNRTLIAAYAKVMRKKLTPKEQASLKAKMEKNQVKAKIKHALITTEEIVAMIGKFAPHLDESLKQFLADEMQKFTHENSDVYQNISDFASTYLEGMLLRTFVRIAEQNPKQEDKDTLIVLTEKLLDITTKKYQEIKQGKKIEIVTKELNDFIMQELLRIDSPEAFEGIPAPLKVKAYEAIKDQLGGFLLRFAQSVQTLDSGAENIKKVKEEVKKFGIAENATKGYVQILTEDIANMVLEAVPHVLNEISGESMKGAAKISTGLEKYLKTLSQGNFRVAKVLLKYSQGAQFQQMLGDNLNKIADKDAFVNDKQKVADLLSNLLIVPLSQVIEKAIHFEEKHKKEFNQQLMAQFLHLGAEHLRYLNAAEAVAAKENREMSYQDFVKVAGTKLHPAVPTSPETAGMQRQAFYDPMLESMLKLIFPHGKDDLTFLSEDLRDPVWKILQKDLFPQIMPMMTEILLEPDTINKIVLSSLESMRDSLSEKIVLDKPEPEDLPFGALDEAAGELIVESLKATTLPEWMKKLIIDKEGKVTPAMKKSLGAALRKEFNDTFIKEKLQSALEKAVKRDAEGNPLLKFDTRPKAVKEGEAIEKAKKMQADLKKVSREVVDVSISHLIRSKWATAQARFDALVKSAFGNIGAKLKKALDAVFRFIFFKVIGTVLSVIFWPLKQIAKQIIYGVIALDENRDHLLAMFTHVPVDQPEGKVSHAVYHEDLVFKIGDALNQTVKEFLDKEPLMGV